MLALDALRAKALRKAVQQRHNGRFGSLLREAARFPPGLIERSASHRGQQESAQKLQQSMPRLRLVPLEFFKRDALRVVRIARRLVIAFRNQQMLDDRLRAAVVGEYDAGFECGLEVVFEELLDFQLVHASGGLILGQI
jgi:hypothetical protein